MALLRMANARYRLRNYAEALADYREILVQHPDSSVVPDAEYGIGLVTLAQGSFDDYARVSLEFVGKHPTHSLAPAVLSQLGRQYLLKGRYGAAETVIARVMTNYPGEASAPETMIKAARADRARESRRGEAMRLREELRDASSTLEPEYLFGLANLYLEEGDCQGALAEYRTILARFPGHPVAPFALLDSAGCHAGGGASLEAREAYRILTRDYGNSKLLPGILYRWGLVALADGDYEAAAGLFRRIMAGAGGPLEAGAAFQLGMTQQKRGMADEALGSFLGSMRLDPGGLFSRRAALGAADAARHLGRRREALRLYGLIIEEGADAGLVKKAREGVANLESEKESPAKEPGRP
jgi:TolA-binding protein